MSVIRLMLVDDHEVLRDGLKALLNSYPDLEVVAEASNGLEAITIVGEVCPDVVVMDITMPEMDGMEATRRVRQACPETQVLALTVHEDKQFFFEMLAAGASGYVTKRTVADELVTAIHAVMEGNVYLQPALARWLLDDYHRLRIQQPPTIQPDTHLLQELSPRERQVIELVAEGLTSPQIAERLEISPKTVSRHRERIMSKLEIQSVADMVKFAIKTGLISI